MIKLRQQIRAEVTEVISAKFKLDPLDVELTLEEILPDENVEFSSNYPALVELRKHVKIGGKSMLDRVYAEAVTLKNNQL